MLEEGEGIVSDDGGLRFVRGEVVALQGGFGNVLDLLEERLSLATGIVGRVRAVDDLEGLMYLGKDFGVTTSSGRRQGATVGLHLVIVCRRYAGGGRSLDGRVAMHYTEAARRGGRIARDLRKGPLKQIHGADSGRDHEVVEADCLLFAARRSRLFATGNRSEVDAGESRQDGRGTKIN